MLANLAIASQFKSEEQVQVRRGCLDHYKNEGLKITFGILGKKSELTLDGVCLCHLPFRWFFVDPYK
jgi:hypothetical protein